MSRAVDHVTETSLHDSPAQEIYSDIVSVLCAPRNFLLEIELLGKAHPMSEGKNYLLEDNYLGIPKAKLVQAFVIARQVFLTLIEVSDCLAKKAGELRNATAVMLLMDPEHLTAANTRKRLIISSRHEEQEETLRSEMQFVDTLLTARLHRHTKSPTLWGHRRWLAQQYRSFGMDVDLKRHLETVVLVAAERHPRNYYAWYHMRWLVETFDSAGKTNKEIVSVILNWVLRHPSDTSGFSFLLFCLKIPGDSEDELAECTRVYDQISSLALSFKWTHESVWVFLRTLAASGVGFGKSGPPFQQGIDIVSQSCSGDPKAQATLKTACKWFEDNKRDSPT